MSTQEPANTTHGAKQASAPAAAAGPSPGAPRTGPWELHVAPPPERWDDWTELDARAWPERRERHLQCIPTICFNCEAACGLLAFVDKADGDIVRFEGNPVLRPNPENFRPHSC